MSAIQSWQALAEEDRLVAELHELGITYLSNRAVEPLPQIRPPEQLLADIVCQPGSRVRTAVIALFLLHPDYSQALPGALARLSDPQQRLLLKLFYTAAVYLQRQYQDQLLLFIRSGWQWLADAYGRELGIAPDLSPKEAIRQLGVRHRALSLLQANWAGTYENVVHHLIQYKQREMLWEPVTADNLRAFLQRLGETNPNSTNFYLLGGSALLLLGSPRHTLDIDYTTDLNQAQQKEFDDLLNHLAVQYRLDVEWVPIEEFVPLPPGSITRRRFVGRFGNYDPVM